MKKSMEISGTHDYTWQCSITSDKQHDLEVTLCIYIKQTEFKFFAHTACAWNTKYFFPYLRFYLRLNFRYENEI